MPIIFREPGLTQDPLRELEQLQRRMDRLFQGDFSPEGSPWQVGVYPLVNLSEDRDHIYVRAELPGVRAEDLEITIQDLSLILRGERKIASEEKQVNYQRRERESGFFRRVLALSSRVQLDKVEATCKDGVLTIKLAKAEEVKPRKIKVKVA
ncbi:MAG: Hsp20/alpha crystallin family protein [Desulfobaccales bacterium]